MKLPRTTNKTTEKGNVELVSLCILVAKQRNFRWSHGKNGFAEVCKNLDTDFYTDTDLKIIMLNQNNYVGYSWSL